MKTGAVIIASGDYGEEQRENEGIHLFLPMYPLDGTTVIKGEIARFRKAGVSPIVVLAGCHSETLKLHLSHNNVIFVEDEAYREHSFEEALKLALEAAAPLMDRALVLPVEYPAFGEETVETLLKAEQAAVPVYGGQAGWPRSVVPGEKDTKAGPGQNFGGGSGRLLFASGRWRDRTGVCLPESPVERRHASFQNQAGDIQGRGFLRSRRLPPASVH